MSEAVAKTGIKAVLSGTGGDELFGGYPSFRRLPAAIRMNYGVQRSQNGGMASRTIAMLPCITGSWKEVGGGFQLSTSAAFGLNNAALERTDLMPSSLAAIKLPSVATERYWGSPVLLRKPANSS